MGKGGEITWMQKVTKSDPPSAYNQRSPSLSKEWWRMFIYQVSAAGFILQSVKPAAFGTSIQGAYALLEPTSKGHDVIAKGSPVLLSEYSHSTESYSFAQKFTKCNKWIFIPVCGWIKEICRVISGLLNILVCLYGKLKFFIVNTQKRLGLFTDMQKFVRFLSLSSKNWDRCQLYYIHLYNKLL